MTVSPSRESRTLPRLGCRNKGLENSVEVGRNDMGDVMADLADPCETLGFGHGGQVTAITKRLSF